MTPNDDPQLSCIERVAVIFLVITMGKCLYDFFFDKIRFIARHYVLSMTEQKHQISSSIKDAQIVEDVTNSFRNAHQERINLQMLHLGGICLLLVFLVNAGFICVDTVRFCVNAEYDYLNLNTYVIVNAVVMVCIVVVVVGLYCFFNNDKAAKLREKDVDDILNSVNRILSDQNDTALREWTDLETGIDHINPPPPMTRKSGIVVNPQHPVHITNTTISSLVELYDTKIYEPSTKPIIDRLSWFTK